jgi:trehalose synthase
MNDKIQAYRPIVGEAVIQQLYQISHTLKDIRIIHINSTAQGGGVAEILEKLVPLSKALGLNARWEVIKGDQEFFQCTKIFHNALQGRRSNIPSSYLKKYEEINASNAEELRPILEEAEVVFIHDPQPAALINYFPKRKGKWIWRCHIDASNPDRHVWKYLRESIVKYDASIFSLDDFARKLPHPIYLIPPSIDPLSEKNIDLSPAEIASIYPRFNIDPLRPMILQVSRFDRFKDPLGVIYAYQLAKKFKPDLQLVLAGGGAPDDPEGDIILNEVQAASKVDPDIHVLFLPPDSHRTINALQRAAEIVLQKSTKEGFGLTVTEAMWKQKPVIGGNTGGIRLQVVNYHTGFLVNTPEGAANRTRYLLQYPERRREIGEAAKQFVKENFLITRHLLEYLTLIVTLLQPESDRIEFPIVNF